MAATVFGQARKAFLSVEGPLCRPFANAYRSDDLTPASPGFAKSRDPCGVHVHSWAAESLTAGSCVAQARPDTLGNQAALQLGNCPQDRKYHPACRRGRVERF
jgi:hypothetical protein